MADYNEEDLARRAKLAYATHCAGKGVVFEEPNVDIVSDERGTHVVLSNEHGTLAAYKYDDGLLTWDADWQVTVQPQVSAHAANAAPHRAPH